MSADERIVIALEWHLPESAWEVGCALRCGYHGDDLSEHLAAVIEPIIRAREASVLRDVAMALEGLRVTSPLNGDGSNYMLDRVLKRLDRVAGNDSPSQAAMVERWAREDAAEDFYRELHGMPPRANRIEADDE